MSNFFDKLGKSLNLEDEQVPSFAYDDSENEAVEEPATNPEDKQANPPQFGGLDVEEIDELMPQEEGIDEEVGTIATLAAATGRKRGRPAGTTKAKTASEAKPKADVFLEEGRLNIDVYESDDEIVIKSAIAGVGDDDLDIDITSDSVRIRGERQMDEEISEDDYFYKECYWGAFSREVRLHTEIDPDKAEAILKNGILTIRLPKLSKTKQKKLKVKKVT